MKLRVPPRLKRGDLIGLISPSSPPKDDARIKRGIAYLMSQGYYVRLGWSVGAKEGYFAGTDALRARDIMDMFADDRVGAILCTRGGYGSARLLEQLDFDFIRSHPKVLVGFSDITALSMSMLTLSGLITFGGPMVAAEFADEPADLTSRMFWETVTRRTSSFTLTQGREEMLAAGTAEGMLIGGNLAVFSSLAGSVYLPDPSGAILFLEDVGENVYKIDRMLLQLRHAGILRSVAGVVLGSFTAIPEEHPNRELDEVLREYFLPLEIPVIKDFPFGHTPEKVTLPFGARVRLHADQRQLIVTDAVVA